MAGNLFVRKHARKKDIEYDMVGFLSLTIMITTFYLCTVVVPSVLCSHLDTNRKSNCSLWHLYISHTLHGSRLHRNQEHSLRKVWIHYISYIKSIILHRNTPTYCIIKVKWSLAASSIFLTTDLKLSFMNSTIAI